MAEMSAWRSALNRSLDANKHLRHARYFYLATVKPDGKPANRTVVFRGFLNETDKITFCTDSRSAKMDHMAACPWAEACWYFADTKEQFRLFGMLTVVGAQTQDAKLQEARRKTWKRMSDPGRGQFVWPQPGKPRSHETDEFNKPPPPAQDGPLPTFALVILDPESVDYVNLSDSTRRQYRRQRKGKDEYEWSELDVNP